MTAERLSRTAAAQRRIEATLRDLGLPSESEPHDQAGRIWRISFSTPAECEVALSANPRWVNVVSLVAGAIPEAAATELMRLNGALALAKLATDETGCLVAAVSLRHEDVDQTHVGDAIRAVLAGVALARDRLANDA